MEWKKIIVQTLVTVIITVGTILVALGRYQATIDNQGQALYTIGLEHKADIELMNTRVKALEQAHLELAGGMSANAAEHKAILRELDNMQKQLTEIQRTINHK